MGIIHEPVMLDTVVHYLQVENDRRFIDGTVGLGGHSAAILRAAAGVQVLGIDRDKDALHEARTKVQEFEPRIHLQRGSYSDMEAFAAEMGWPKVDGILLDLGVSSLQLDTAERGFSFRHDAPLDMRMDRRSRVTAASLLNELSEDELTEIFRSYGEERRARQVARAVVARRGDQPWSQTGELAELVEAIVGYSRHGPPAPTRVFQALRIAVNHELEELEIGLRASLNLLTPGGRLVVISFHSLEDRLVKNFIRDEAKECICPPEFPLCRCNKRATLVPVSKKPVRPSRQEMQRNPRSSSAKLRVAEKRA